MKLYSDGMYGKSNGGKTFSGWTCEHLPYLVELDNFGASRHQGQPGGPNEKLYVWGYDEITWFAHQTKEYRAKWLQYAWDWLRDTDTNAHLQMPGSRTATSSDTRGILPITRARQSRTARVTKRRSASFGPTIRPD